MIRRRFCPSAAAHPAGRPPPDWTRPAAQKYGSSLQHRAGSTGHDLDRIDRGLLASQPGDPPRYQQIQGLPSNDTNEGALLVEGSDAYGWERPWASWIRAGEMEAVPPLAAPSLLGVRRDSWSAQGPDSVLGYPIWPRSDLLGGRPSRTRYGRGWRPLRVPQGGRAVDCPLRDGPAVPDDRFLAPRDEIRIMPANGTPGPRKRMDIYVHPPWYRQPPAYMAWSVLAVALIVLVIRGRFALLNRRNRELNRKVNLATTELRRHRENLELLVKERTSKLTQAVAALNESETRYQTLFDNAKDGIALADAEAASSWTATSACARWWSGQGGTDKGRRSPSSIPLFHPLLASAIRSSSTAAPIPVFHWKTGSKQKTVA